MRSCARILLVTICVAALPGCQSLFSSHGRVAEASAPAVDLQGYFEQRLAEGRRHLLADRPSLAVVAFRQASYDASVRARAFNGMAVAYDRLGRVDLAQRYFMAAVELEPDNVSFAANLIRFNESLADARAIDPVAVAQAEALLVGPPGIPDDGEAMPEVATVAPDRMQRISPNEIRIAARSETEIAPDTNRSNRAATRAGAGNLQGRPQSREYPVRVVLAGPGEQADQPAARVRVEGQATTDRNRPRARVAFSRGPRSYPVRIYFDES